MYSHVFDKMEEGHDTILNTCQKEGNTRIHDDTGKSAPHPIAKLERDHVDSSAPGGRSAPHAHVHAHVHVHANECPHSVVWVL